MLKSNYLTTIVDILHHRLQVLIPEPSPPPAVMLNNSGETDSIGDQSQWPAPEGPQVDPVAKAIMILLAHCLEDLARHLILDSENKSKQGKEKSPCPAGQQKQTSPFDDLALRVHDQVSYTIATGIVDKLAAYFNGVQDPIDDRPEVGEFLLAGLDLLSALTVCVEALIAKPLPLAIPSSEINKKGPNLDMSSASSIVDGVGSSSSSTAGLLHIDSVEF